MAFDIIVFSQKELESALNSGITNIALCDNAFILPNTYGISYTAIGTVEAGINAGEKEFCDMNITCVGFKPKLSSKKAPTMNVMMPLTSYRVSASSYISSYFMSSYFMSSYITSYIYEYEYEYETGSFASSYSSSFRSSISSFVSSFLTSFIRNRGSVCIMVNGYGINLI